MITDAKKPNPLTKRVAFQDIYQQNQLTDAARAVCRAAVGAGEDEAISVLAMATVIEGVSPGVSVRSHATGRQARMDIRPLLPPMAVRAMRATAGSEPVKVHVLWGTMDEVEAFRKEFFEAASIG